MFVVGKIGEKSYYTKSLYASADDELRKKIMDIVHKSKTEALISSFTHYENRDVNPHIHIHSQIFNQAKFYFEDGTSQILVVDYQDVFKKFKKKES